MTREEAIAYFKDMNECTYGDVEPIQMAIKALEQEPCEDCVSRQAVLDKIRAEIEQTFIDDAAMQEYTVEECLRIIDKYKTESEDKE